MLEMDDFANGVEDKMEAGVASDGEVNHDVNDPTAPDDYGALEQPQAVYEEESIHPPVASEGRSLLADEAEGDFQA